MPRNATQRDIVRAYRQIVKSLHPDLNRSASAAAQFGRATAAYQALRDSASRAAYDKSLDRKTAPVARVTRPTRGSAAGGEKTGITLSRLELGLIGALLTLAAVGAFYVIALAAGLTRPVPAAVRLTAAQVILPAGQLPLAGYTLTEDTGDFRFWRRVFLPTPTAPTAGPYDYVLLQLWVENPSTTGTLAGSLTNYMKCEATDARGGTLGGKPPLTATLALAPILGDGSSGCLFAFPDGGVKFNYTFASRNVVVMVQISPHAEVRQSAMVEGVVTLARRQLEVIDRAALP